MGADRFYPNGGVYRLDPGEVPGLGFYREADHDRIVAEAEARGWNAAITSALTWLERVDHYWLGVGSEGQDTMVKYWQLKPQIAALRKPEVEG